MRSQSRKPTTQKNSCSWNHGDASFTSMFILTSGSICKWIPIARVLSRIKVQSQRIKSCHSRIPLGTCHLLVWFVSDTKLTVYILFLYSQNCFFTPYTEILPSATNISLSSLGIIQTFSPLLKCYMHMMPSCNLIELIRANK